MTTTTFPALPPPRFVVARPMEIDQRPRVGQVCRRCRCCGAWCLTHYVEPPLYCEPCRRRLARELG
jgi:hypothetical protein